MKRLSLIMVTLLFLPSAPFGQGLNRIVVGPPEGDHDVRDDLINLVPQVGACCIEFECVGNMEEQDCLDLGGIWFEGQDCDVFVCPTDPCQDAIFHNGEPDGINGYVCDRRSTPGDLEGWCVADVEFTDRVRIDGLHWWTVTDIGYDWQQTGDFIILEDAGDQPGTEIYEEFDVPNSRVDTGEIMFGRHLYIYTFEVDITLPAGTYWFGMRPVNQGTGGQNFWVSASDNLYRPLFFRSDYFGFPDWDEGCDFDRCYDVAFCITGTVVCTYAAGDCNHNGVPLELEDVVLMIGMYRGTAEAQYTCPCPHHGLEFAPEADPNGNCLAFELGDVVAEIAAYRGTGQALGCEDCPGSRRLIPNSSIWK